MLAEKQPFALIVTLAITIVLQFFAAMVAVRLTKVTKFNLSWILISFGFIFMAIQRLAEFLPFVTNFKPQDFTLFYTWLGAITSLFFAVGVFLIRKIFKHMKEVERKTRNQEKALLSAVIQAEERERRRFAREIHDGLGPLLSTIKMSVSSLAELETNPSAQPVIKNTKQAVSEAIKSIQDISNNLSPHILTNFGIVKATRNFINKVNQSKGLKVSFKSNLSDQRFSAALEVVLYRSICELINNSIKHAKASKVDIEIATREQRIEIDYNDNGVGFDASQLFSGNKEVGTGYFNMLSRIKSMKGKLQVNSNKNQGVHVHIILPSDGK